MPQSAQKRSSREWGLAQRGQVSGPLLDDELGLIDLSPPDPEGADAGLLWILQGDDQVDRVGPELGQIDVGL
jgi:hypothetical protein